MKTNMTGDVHLVRSRVKTSVSVVRGAVTKEDTRNGSKIHFMLIVSPKMRKALTPKNLEKREVGLTFK